MAKVFSGNRAVGILGLVALVLFFLLVGWATYSSGVLDRHMQFGVLIYILGVGAMILGFASREDAIAIGAVMGLNLLVILDIALRIGVLPKF